jgi:hypothetical protein
LFFIFAFIRGQIFTSETARRSFRFRRRGGE